MDLVASPPTVIAAGLVLLLFGELVALANLRRGDTLSEIIRAWVAVSRVRVVVLAAALILLFTHIVYEWPW